MKGTFCFGPDGELRPHLMYAAILASYERLSRLTTFDLRSTHVVAEVNTSLMILACLLDDLRTIVEAENDEEGTSDE
jgi:hypothetical protein